MMSCLQLNSVIMETNKKIYDEKGTHTLYTYMGLECTTDWYGSE